jgi:hypothetical protein
MYQATLRSAGLWVGLFLLAAVSGCRTRVVHGEETVYTSAWWLGPTVLLIGLAAAAAGWRLRRWSGWLGYFLLAAGLALALILVPGVYHYRVKVDADHLETHHGAWWSPVRHHLRFDDLKELRWGSSEIPARNQYGQVVLTTIYFLVGIRKSGEEEMVEVGGLLREALPEVLNRARARGVPIIEKHFSP